MAEWARVVATTIEDHLRGYEDMIMRRRILLRRLKSAGRLKFNASGDTFTWRVKKAQRNIAVNNGAQPITFQPVNLWKKCALDYEGYVITDAITKREKLKNRGTPQIIDVWGEMIDSMMDDLEDRFSEELYINSAATGNTGRCSGLDTMFGTPTQTVNISTTTSTAARTANAADPVAYPVVTNYAGVTTVLGDEGGSWNAPWPYGKGDVEFDYFAPLGVNYTSTHFDGSSTAWKDNCVLATRFGIMYSNRNRASEGQVDLCLFDTNLYRQFKDKKDSIERTVINNGTKDREYGIADDSFEQDGAEITHEFGIPTNVGYGLNIRKTLLASMQDKLFASDGPNYDQPSRSWRAEVDFLGQMKFHSPRHFCKWSAIA